MTYRQTIKRYPRTLSIPIVLCMVMALWVVAGSPKSYESGVSLWVDHAAPAPSSLTESDTLMQTTPADQEQQIITELLSTRDFRMAVARRGPLAAYLASNPSKGWGPSALLAGLRGMQPLDAQVTAALGPKKLTSEVSGPQVLHVTYAARTPAVAAGTVKALIDEINARLGAFAAARNRTSVAFAQSAVDSASRAVADAQKRLTDYRGANPGAGFGDPHFVALVKAARAAARQLSAATARFNEVSSGKDDGASGTSFSVVDPPRAPTGPVSGKKKLIMAVFGGLFAGALISGLLLLILTPSPSQDPLPAPRPLLREVRGEESDGDGDAGEPAAHPAQAGG